MNPQERASPCPNQTSNSHWTRNNVSDPAASNRVFDTNKPSLETLTLMPEYTLISVLIAGFIFLSDWLVLRTGLFRQKKFWLFQLIGLGLTLVFDGVLENLPIVLFDYQYTLGVRIINIPLENFLFGFNLLYLSVILYEYLYAKIPFFAHQKPSKTTK
jgi:lycopene cyclase domain-containing protein